MNNYPYSCLYRYSHTINIRIFKSAQIRIQIQTRTDNDKPAQQKTLFKKFSTFISCGENIERLRT